MPPSGARPPDVSLPFAPLLPPLRYVLGVSTGVRGKSPGPDVWDAASAVEYSLPVVVVIDEASFGVSHAQESASAMKRGWMAFIGVAPFLDTVPCSARADPLRAKSSWRVCEAWQNGSGRGSAHSAPFSPRPKRGRRNPFDISPVTTVTTAVRHAGCSSFPSR